MPGTYKIRKGGSTRKFGGVNVLMLGDFSQLKPVGGTWLCSYPYIGEGRVQNAMTLFWDDGQDTINGFWSLKTLLRCVDVWYNEFLGQCRAGALTSDMYAFFHGLPTLLAAVENCECNKDAIDDPVLGRYKKSWADAFKSGETDAAAMILETECTKCAAERKRRRRVLHTDEEPPIEWKRHPFPKAPALYSFNIPRYFAIQIRAREFAKQNKLQLCWCYAHDTPLHPGDCELPQEALDAKRRRWLTRHDQDTANITSILPLAVGMPMRLLDSIDREKFLYRGRRVTLHGWTLHPERSQEEMDGEMVLDRLPLVIYIHCAEAEWQIGKLPVGVYPMTPRSRTWKVNKYTGIEAKRTGYLLLPDFGSTAHMIQGATLEAAFYDGQDVASNTGGEAQIAAYVCLSRIKELDKIAVIQPFSPLLFKRGPPKASMLLERGSAAHIFEVFFFLLNTYRQSDRQRDIQIRQRDRKTDRQTDRPEQNRTA